MIDIDEEHVDLLNDEKDYWQNFTEAKKEYREAKRWVEECYNRWYKASLDLRNYENRKLKQNDTSTDKKASKTS